MLRTLKLLNSNLKCLLFTHIPLIGNWITKNDANKTDILLHNLKCEREMLIAKKKYEREVNGKFSHSCEVFGLGKNS